MLGALSLGAALLPLIAVVALLVAVDLGWPPIFWQKRVGRNGRPFLIYKFRTLHAPYDRRGRAVPEAQRASRLGAFLRRARLDEAPQLLNVLVGDMSLVGPRPLLPVDQPADGGARLRMRPGLSGWAQIKGGRVLSAAEKGALDDWYVRHASLALDCAILAQTLAVAFSGDRRAPVAEPAAGCDPAARFQPRENRLLTPASRLR